MAGSSRVEHAEIRTYRLRLRNMRVPHAGGQRGLSAANEGRDISAVTASATLRLPEPVLVLDRFAPLHAQLIALLRGLTVEDWGRPTVCALWSVRDIAAHLLDDDLRRLSFHRDGHAPTAGGPASTPDLVAFVNRMN